MIKIKKLKNINSFYQNLEVFATQVYSGVKIFRDNNFCDDTIGFYFRKISKTTIAIYYETGKRYRGFKLLPNKTFLICKHFKLFKKDFIFAFILISPADYWFLLLCLISGLILVESIIEFLVSLTVLLLVFYFRDFKSILKLLNFFDDIANENKEEI